ncbi:flagellar hook-basal body complex protein, partial [Hydrogenophaga sp.]|uniref:flagellar hook-basal body complex protein n=1 Tax=Hydrogenophaga sp. TaxID=1904254 RepID=UPI0027202AAC
MAFQQGLSGLNSASRNLDVIGHNIANANTVGMKSSRAEFAELYASSVNAAGGANKGIGVTVATVSQLFTQGNITVTGNDLDLAINGNGFFEVTQPNGTMAYTRAGMFQLDRE